MKYAKSSQIISNAIHDHDASIETISIPVADGGEGTVDAFLHSVGGEKIYTEVKDPLMRNIEAYFGLLDDGETAVIEMAQASGLGLVEDDRRPLEASTYGTGQLIKAALDWGSTRIILGLGGSATTDGGTGAMSALGVKFLSKYGTQIPMGGGGLVFLESIDISEIDTRLHEVEIIMACDVDNPLFGENGAASVYAPQKGADIEKVQILDSNLEHYAKVIEAILGIDVSDIAGGGAAGGLGIALAVLLDARFMPGIEVVLDTVQFDQIIADSDLIITGEGRIDKQTENGKAPMGIAMAAKEYAIPVVAIGGSLGLGYESIYDKGVKAAFSVVNSITTFETVNKTCRDDLYQLIRNLMRYRDI